jgi:hypothetical protein
MVKYDGAECAHSSSQWESKANKTNKTNKKESILSTVNVNTRQADLRFHHKLYTKK